MQTALIFGASRGLGAALAREFVHKGFNVVACARSGTSVTCNVAVPSDIERVVSDTIRQYGSIDVAVFCAGVSDRTDIGSLDPQEYLHTFSVNMHSIVHGIASLLPHMKAHGRGTIVGISSLNDVKSIPGNSAYVASKSALTVLLEGAAIELRPYGIDVVCVRPGFIDTDMTKHSKNPRPFLLSADRAARIIVSGILNGKQRIQFPWPLVVASAITKIIPNRSWQYLISRRFAQHVPLFVLLLCCSLLFIGLGDAELQPWDESFYAMRARAIVEKGAWWDQTEYALGGLYTSVSPPLTEWMMALSMFIFGTTPLAVRLYGALCGVGLLALLYQIARLYADRRTALLGVVLLAGSMTFNTYARHGMVDVPLMMWCTLALLGVVRTCKSDQSVKRYAWCSVVAIAVAAAGMTKIVLSLIPLLFVLYPLLQQQYRRHTMIVAGAMVAGVLLAAPWYVSMLAVYGESFSSMFLLPHYSTVIQGGHSPLGVLYYVNQLLVTSPFTILAFVWLLLLVKNPVTYSRLSSDATLEGVLGIWFFVAMLVFSTAETKFPHYSVVMIIPATLLSLRILKDVRTNIAGRTAQAPKSAVRVIMLSVLVACVWGLSQPLRDHIQSFFAFGVIFTATHWQRIDRIMFRLVVTLVPVGLLCVVSYSNLNSSRRGVVGGKLVAEWLERSSSKAFSYVYHEFDPSDSLAPQLAWYTGGWPTGWREGYAMSTHSLPFTTTNVRKLTEACKESVPLVYYIPSDDELSRKDIAQIKSYKRLALLAGNYAVFE